MMTARSRNFERTPRSGMTDDIDEIGERRARTRTQRLAAYRHQMTIDRPGKVRAQRGEVGGAEDIDARHERRFGSASQGQIDLRHADVGVVQGSGITAARRAGKLPRGAARHGERTAHGTQRARQGQLSGELAMQQRLSRNLPARRQDTERDRQVEAPRFLRQIRRREVDGDTANRELETTVLKCGANALTAFPDFEIG